MPAPLALLLALVLAPEPASAVPGARFVTRAEARVEPGRVVVEIAADGALSDARPSAKLGSDYLYVYLEGVRARGDNRAWPAQRPDGLDVVAHRHAERVEIKVRLPAQAGCSGTIRLRPAAPHGVVAELPCASAAAATPSRSPDERTDRAATGGEAAPDDRQPVEAETTGTTAASGGATAPAAPAAPESAASTRRAPAEFPTAPRRPAPAAGPRSGPGARTFWLIAGATALGLLAWGAARARRSRRQRDAVDGDRAEPPGATAAAGAPAEPGPRPRVPADGTAAPGPDATLPDAPALHESAPPPTSGTPPVATEPAPSLTPTPATASRSARRAELERRLIESLFGPEAATRPRPAPSAEAGSDPAGAASLSTG